MRFCIVLLLCFAGCGPFERTTTEYSAVLTEPAEVYDTAYVPAGHGHDVAVGYDVTGEGGITITPINIDIPERYAVIFKCQHGKFVIDSKKAEELYKRLNRGDAVLVKYREVYRVVLLGEEELSRTAYDLDFLDAIVAETRPEAEKGEDL